MIIVVLFTDKLYYVYSVGFSLDYQYVCMRLIMLSLTYRLQIWIRPGKHANIKKCFIESNKMILRYFQRSVNQRVQYLLESNAKNRNTIQRR